MQNHSVRCLLCKKFAKSEEVFKVWNQHGVLGSMHRAGKGCRRAKFIPAKPKRKVIVVQPERHPIAGMDIATALMSAGFVPTTSLS